MRLYEISQVNNFNLFERMGVLWDR